MNHDVIRVAIPVEEKLFGLLDCLDCLLCFQLILKLQRRIVLLDSFFSFKAEPLNQIVSVVDAASPDQSTGYVQQRCELDDRVLFKF